MDMNIVKSTPIEIMSDYNGVGWQSWNYAPIIDLFA